MRFIVPVALVAVAGLWSVAAAQDGVSPARFAQAAPAGTGVPADQAPVAAGVPPTSPDARSAVAPIPRQLEGELLASDLVGQLLYDTSGTRIGLVEDLLLDRDRKAKGLIVSLGAGGAESKRVAVAFEAFRRSGSDREVRLVVQLDPAALRSMARFESMAKEASQDDNQDLTTGGTATGGSVPKN